MHNNHLSLGIIAILALGGCATLGATDDPPPNLVATSRDSDGAVPVAASSAEALGATDDPPLTPVAVSYDSDSAVPVAVSPADLVRCQMACNAGREAMSSFCRSLPDPRLKAGCWLAAGGTAIACLNWCYWQWGK